VRSNGEDYGEQKLTLAVNNKQTIAKTIFVSMTHVFGDASEGGRICCDFNGLQGSFGQLDPSSSRH